VWPSRQQTLMTKSWKQKNLFIEVVANAAIGGEYQDRTCKTRANSQLLV